jgi:hypothetical protein
MKIYEYRGRRPFYEIEHIKSLLGDLWRGYHPYVPEHTDQDSTIILHLLNEDEQKTQDYEYANDIRPTLLSRRWQQVQAILRQDGYEVEER